MQWSWTPLELGLWSIRLFLVSWLGCWFNCCSLLWLLFNRCFSGGRLLLLINTEQVKFSKTSLNIGKGRQIYDPTVRSRLLELFDYGAKLFRLAVFVIISCTIEEHWFACYLLLRRWYGCQRDWLKLEIWCGAINTLDYLFGFLRLNEFVFDRYLRVGLSVTWIAAIKIGSFFYRKRFSCVQKLSLALILKKSLLWCSEYLSKKERVFIYAIIGKVLW